MKKSEALSILGLHDGATDDEIKKAHRVKVIEHHPDKYAQDPEKHAWAEEQTKRINEARDVLISRKWEPEYGRGPYANPYNPYANPYGGSPARGQGGGTPGSSNNPYGDPFGDWPFGGGQGQTTWVWTSWDGASQAGNPFDPFGTAQPQKTPAERYEDAKKDLRTELGVIGVKLVCLAVLSVLASPASGLFLYVAASVIYGLWKRLGSCLIAFFFPIALIGAPFLMLIAPRAGAVTFGLAIFFALAVLFDIVNVRNAVTLYRQTRKAAGPRR
ncbi:J domain-containing protein [Raoultibacter phocaeensis]|uniref:J domain-containing protein n=1 Tax=Raoultibacter phocaeensis TaxID=2479841 RepID=UPI00111BA61E|nr:DnaJ domain-containing protein [Raoultibacter phocaeensis]